MPVPVPRISKPLAHPVIKKNFVDDGYSNPFHNLTRTLPVSPTGPPPSFGTRDQWVASLPSWRRAKPRRIWEDEGRSAEQVFYKGLAAADDASVIKGARAEACVPPLFTLLQVHNPRPLDLCREAAADADDEMSPASDPGDHRHFERTAQWPENNAKEMDVDQSQSQLDLSAYEQYERGAFSPVFEDQSPDGGSGHVSSSPLEPATPFGVFVDRVATNTDCVLYNDFAGLPVDDHAYPLLQEKYGTVYQAPPAYSAGLELPKEPVPAPASLPEVVTPTATAGYKKLAEPLSEWVANYVWKACTSGFGYSASHPIHNTNRQSLASPPSYLATSVHSLLLSTLLQPSAVFLALWYISRLPVSFGPIGYTANAARHQSFRMTLLGEGCGSMERESMEASAPFRLVVLGCMLANKWLDDHTFSNKTWHTISNVPIQALNKLESEALDIFAYDLSIPSGTWGEWLLQLMSYHLSLSSPSRPQPISRPSTSPHSIVRKALEEIIQAPAACNFDPSRPQPVFLGLEERRREIIEKEHALTVDVLEIDLDEDGPLREEYLPKRRVSGPGSTRSSGHPVPTHGKSQTWEKNLPPPAKWSPAGDEPILRERNRVSGQYVAVQPPQATAVPSFQHPPQYRPSHELGYVHPLWPGNTYLAVKAQPNLSCIDTIGLQPPAQLAYSHCPLLLSVPVSHSRSQSLSYDQDTSQPRNHIRSHSQSRFEYQCSDLRMTANELAPELEAEAHWPGQYAYPAPAFLPHHSVSYQSSWLRT